MYTISVFILLHIALIFAILLTIYIINSKTKNQIHYSYLASSIFMGIWSLGGLLDNYSTLITGNYNIKFFWIGSIGLFFCPVTLLISSRIFLTGKIKFNYKYKLLFIIPIISFIMLVTNKYHNLYYETYSIYNYATVYGKYFTIHSLYSYICILVALFNFIIATVRTSGAFSKQSILVVVSSIVPLTVNVLFTYKILPLTMYITCVAFSFTIICLYFAIQKYGFLDITPLSMQKVIDSISDAFIIIDRNYKVINYNLTFETIFGGVGKIVLKDNFFEKVSKYSEIDIELLKGYIHDNREKLEKKKISKYFKSLDKHFDIELIPILSNDEYLATLALLKDVTQLKKSQETLIEQERLVTLGQLAGGMAHDINTPLASIKRAMFFFEESEMFESEESRKILEATKISIDKIGKIVNSVRDQIRNVGEESITNFSLLEAVKNTEMLLYSELKKTNCNMEILGEDICINGDMNKFEQVIMNFAINSLQAYQELEKKNETVRVAIIRKGDEAVIEISDHAGGLPQKIVDSIFNQILTTKGTKGTGFGLYFSNSIIKANFNGRIEFTTKEGIGTTFYIIIPIK